MAQSKYPNSKRDEGEQSRKDQASARSKFMRENTIPASPCQIDRNYSSSIWVRGIMPPELSCLEHMWPLFGADPSQYLQVPRAVITLGSPLS